MNGGSTCKGGPVIFGDDELDGSLMEICFVLACNVKLNKMNFVEKPHDF